jgi:hemoglobin-like flavoprotein
LPSGQGDQELLRRVDFDQILLESVNESISVTLGRQITPELYHHLQAYLGLSLEEMPNHVVLLFDSLGHAFGLLGGDLCKLVVRKMYQKAGVPFYDVAGTRMIQHVNELKRILAMAERSKSSQQSEIHSP